MSPKTAQGARVSAEQLASLSHEFRTPLNGVLGMARLLEGTRLTDEQRAYVAALRESGEHLLSLVNDVLDFARLGARVLLVYPGPGDMLNQRASEFLAGRMLPANFSLLLDPAYQFTNLYGLRWEAPKETAYPSTFLIDAKGSVFFAKVAKAHGGRTTAAEMLEELGRHKSM